MGADQTIPFGINSTWNQVSGDTRGDSLGPIDETGSGEDFFWKAFDFASIGMAIVAVDGTFVRTNAAFDRMLGYGPGDLIGVHRSTVTALEDIAKNEERFRRLQQGGLSNQSYEQRYARKDGHFILVDISESYVRGPKGKPGFCTIIAGDIRGQTRLDEAWQKGEGFSRLLAENDEDIVWTMDMNLAFTYMTPSIARFKGISPDHLVGRKIQDVMETAADAKILSVLEEEVAKEDGKKTDVSRSRVFEVEHVKADGWTGWAEVKVCFLRDAKGRANGILGMTRDITRRKKDEMELRMKSLKLEEINTALKVLLEQREIDKKELEDNIFFNVKQLVMPYIDSLKQKHLGEEQKTYLDILESNLKSIISPFAKKLTFLRESFTPLEIRVANLTREGKTVKEIANTFGVSESAISLHRQHIRNKLGLKNQKINLTTYLSSLT